MKFSGKLAAGFSALGLLAVAAPSVAAPSLTFTTAANGTQVIDPFGGFDYISNATAVSTAPVFDGTSIITTTYLASANAIQDPGGNNYNTPGIRPTTPLGSNPWEFTVKATITETAICILAGGPTGCVTALFTATGGSWDVYYDSTADADILAGTGYINGTRVLGGNISAGTAGTFTAINATSGTGTFAFFGGVTFTQTDNTKDAFFNPALTNTVAGAEIKIGGATTGWTAPTTWTEGGGIPTGALVFQADGNQSFTAVPEPGTLALVGLSLVGLGMVRRRRHG